MNMIICSFDHLKVSVLYISYFGPILKSGPKFSLWGCSISVIYRTPYYRVLKYRIQGIVYDRFKMVLGYVPDVQDIFPDSFSIGVAIASKL